MQTITINNEAHGDATEATVFGPFFVEGAPRDRARRRHRRSVPPVSPAGSRARSPTPTVTRSPARLEVWEADEDGLYDVQYGDDRTAARGHLFSGRGRLVPVLGPHPDAVSDPARRPGRQAARVDRALAHAAAHLHFMVQAPGHRTLVTHIFVRGDDFVDSDAVFGVKDSLIRDFHRQAPGHPPPTDG